MEQNPVNGCVSALGGCSGCSGCIWLYLVGFGCAEWESTGLCRFCIETCGIGVLVTLESMSMEGSLSFK